jgi:hypothetical protein
MVYMSADGKKAGAVNYTVKEWWEQGIGFGWYPVPII